MRRPAHLTTLATCQATRPTREKLLASSDSKEEVLRRLIENQVVGLLEAILERLKFIGAREGDPAPDECRAIRLPEVLHLLGISKSALYDRMNPKSASHDPEMPRPFKLGRSEHSPSVWRHSAVIAYLKSRSQLSRVN